MRRVNAEIIRDGNFMHVTYRRKTIEIGAGTSDNISVFVEGNYIYVLSYNISLSYVGCEMYSPQMEKVKEIFFQDIDEIQGVTPLRKPFFDYSEPFMTKILAEYLDYMD